MAATNLTATDELKTTEPATCDHGTEGCESWDDEFPCVHCSLDCSTGTAWCKGVLPGYAGPKCRLCLIRYRLWFGDN
ncbi:hypothetical protein [Halomarina oriensis]|uniref:Uncharacterized protein n=1 Tax=Halomarina oriensis TaxID=671145 RepID=A0A6B0GDV8_9EURY|nr:hypothetical protein [Halomarina oriensis]MWG33116.1 hypothetical protein [Halomarina oriensis]